MTCCVHRPREMGGRRGPALDQNRTNIYSRLSAVVRRKVERGRFRPCEWNLVPLVPETVVHYLRGEKSGLALRQLQEGPRQAQPPRSSTDLVHHLGTPLPLRSARRLLVSVAQRARCCRVRQRSPRSASGGTPCKSLRAIPDTPSEGPPAKNTSATCLVGVPRGFPRFVSFPSTVPKRFRHDPKLCLGPRHRGPRTCPGVG